jgi:hypothetical protein
MKFEYVAIDCEMVETEKSTNSAARVTLVDQNCKLLMDEYITQESRVISYRTKYSGITRKILTDKGKGTRNKMAQT